MKRSESKSRVIPINKVADASTTAGDAVHLRLLREGWLRQTIMSEPRLSELVKTYESLGYEVRVEAYQETDAESVSTGAGAGCGGGATAGTGCGGGSCHTGVDLIAGISAEPAQPLSILYIRKGTLDTGGDQPP
jgi:hypothetical protein